MTKPTNTVLLTELAKSIRSKNAGVDKITFDIIFERRADFDRVCSSGVLSRAAIAKLYSIEPSRISDHVLFVPALAIKFSIFRQRPSGSIGDGDIFGSQHYGPLLDIEVPTE